MLRALVANLRAGHTRQGGSTITQQVVKNILLDPERTYSRKIKETILARRLEQHLAKDEILGLYLNHIYLGHGRYGVEEAARYYFGKKCREVDVAEAALLAGIVASPERFSPRSAPERALARRRYVLDQMLAKGWVTRALHDQAQSTPLNLAPAVEAESELAPEIIPLVSDTLRQIAGEHARRGGFTVNTTIDPRLQSAARQAVRVGLEAYAKRQKLLPPYTAKDRRLWGKAFKGVPKINRIYVGTVEKTDDADNSILVRVGDVLGRVALGGEGRFNPGHLAPNEFTRVGAALRVGVAGVPEGSAPVPLRLELGPEAALVALDARTREVLALVGSAEALVGGLDRATKAHRQPGSSFKPFLYSYALHSRRFTPASILELAADPKGDSGAPRRESVRTALARSDNAAAEKLIEEVGAANVVEWAHALGIESPLGATPSLALGAYEVTPYEMANAFATFAAGGTVEPPRLIAKIGGTGDRAVPLPPRPPQRRVMQPEEAYLITSLMKSVVEQGTARRATTLKRPLAGKTGTTNDAKDAWFAGFSTDIVATVWVGYDDALPLGWGEAGAATALPIWIDFMRAAHEHRAPTEFPRPSSVVVARIDPATGLLAYPGQADPVDEEFLDGTVPDQTASPDAGPVESPDAAVGGPDNAPAPSHPAPEPGGAGAVSRDGGAAPEPPPF
jgi:penicillin-binding protein 1A